MKAERLLELYERISEAPDAVTRLRRFVLDLAVRGKLVEQDPEDEPASALLARISAEKEQLLANDKRRNAPNSEPAHASEPFFALPPGWICSRIEDLGVISPRNDSPDDAIASFVPMPKITSEYGYPHQHEPRTWGDIKKGYTHFAEGDVGLAKITPCFENGKSTVFRNLTGGIGAGTTELHVLRPILVNPDYVLLFLKSPHFIETGIPNMTGTAGQKRVPRGYFANTPFPLPPLAEQRRIVAKVDELMALSDRLEEHRGTREATRDRLTAATLSRLTAPDANEQSFRTRARFALDTIPTLTARPDQIKPLRRTILNLAVHGQIVEQNSSDEPASLLLERIAKKRSKRLEEDYPSPAEAKTQKKKQAKQKLPSGLPALPVGWAWATLQQCSLIVIDCKNKTAPYTSEGVKLVRTTNVRDGSLNFLDQKYVSEDTFEKWSLRGKPAPGDILITREAPMGEACIVPEGERVCLGQRMMLARLVPETISPRFLLYSLRDPALMDRVQDKPLGMTVQHLRVGGVETLLIPLPPLEEQRRIVAKLDELMALCDRLEASLQQADDKRARLLESLFTEALAPAEVALEAA